MGEHGDGSWQTPGPNADGNGGGSSIAVLAMASVVVAPAILIGLARLLIDTRSVIVSVVNNTDNALTKIADHHESGEFDRAPPSQISERGFMAFSSKAKSFVTGTIGSVTYTGDGFTVLMGWNNPRIGNNSTNVQVDGLNRGRILVLHQHQPGDESAKMSFLLFKHPDYSVSNSLKLKGDLRRGIRAFKSPGSIISLRELVDY